MTTVAPKIFAVIKSRRPGLSDAAMTSPQSMTRDDFLILQSLAEQLDDDHAQGHDFLSMGDGMDDGESSFRDAQKVVSDLMDASPWTLHPDYGCVLADDVGRLDAGVSKERFTVKLVAPSGAVMGQQMFSEPDGAMRAYSALRHSKFGLYSGAGAYVALMDDRSQFDASYLHEGHQVYREQFAKEAGHDLAMKVLREDLTSPERRVEVRTATLTDDRLDWAVAEALGHHISDEQPVWVVGNRQYGVAGLDVTGAPLFKPSGKPEMAQRLMEMEGIGTQKIADGHWRAMSQDGSSAADGADVVTAGLRAIVLQRAGEKVSVPTALAATVHSNEPLVDAVVMERVAAHYTDYFHGPVYCEYAQDRDGQALVEKLSIWASYLPAHAGSPSAAPNSWSMGDKLTKSDAVAIARAYPAIREMRDARAAMLLGKRPAWENDSQDSRDALQALQTAVVQHRVAEPDLKLWAAIEWTAASEMLKTEGYTPEMIAQAMSELSPVCVLPKECENLGTWLSSEVQRRQALQQVAVEGAEVVGP